VAVLAWLRTRGAPFDEHTSANAAGAGKIDALRWLRGRAGTPGCVRLRTWTILACHQLLF
jgi:hypothetical protein